MELRVLRYFLAILDSGNISQASKKLHLSQPTISRQITNLEQELGTLLFIRKQRTMILTAAGEYFAKQARQILALADKTKANIHKKQEISGTISIGCAETPMFTTIARCIKRLRTKFPKVKVTIHGTDADSTYKYLKNGIFDFGLIMEPSDKSNYNFMTLPGKTEWGVLTRKDSNLGNKETITAQDLNRQEMILPRQHSEQPQFSDWAGNNKSKFKRVATYNLLNNAALLVQERVGHALCLAHVVNTAQSELTFVPLAPTLTAKASLIWPKEVLLSDASRLLLQELQASD